MKLGRMEKITLAVVILLVITAIVSVTMKIRERNRLTGMYVTEILTDETKPLPEGIKTLSEKYKGYENLYSSDKKVLSYGYLQYTLDKKDGKSFHEELQSKLAKKNFNYEVITYENWTDYDINLEKANKAVYEENSEKCLMENPSVQELDLLRDTSKECLMNVCIIDVKNNRYTVISRDIDYIMTVLEEHNAD